MPPTNRRRKNQNKREKGVKPELQVREGQDPHYQQVTITTLRVPDDVLLEIFDFTLEDDSWQRLWQRLVHVCKRWRHVVLASPFRLNLRLRCTEFTPARRMLGVWPALPLVVELEPLYPSRQILGVQEGSLDNIIAALEQNDRVYRVNLGGIRSRLLQECAAVMQGPFPALTFLNLEPRLYEESVPVLPDSFLGGYAPHLQELVLPDIPIPVFQKLPVSSPNLSKLHLWKISYISPETMTNCLSALPRLKCLLLKFQSRLHPSLTDRTSRHPSPLTRVILPSITSLQYKGTSEYLEALVSRVDIPLLKKFFVTFFNQVIFDISQLPQFISRTEKFKALNKAGVTFYSRSVKVLLVEKRGTTNHASAASFRFEILCTKPDWQLSSLAQVCSSFSHRLSTLGDLAIRRSNRVNQLQRWPDDMESTQWLELLSPLTTVKNLYVSDGLSPYVALALEDLPGERVTEVSPALQHLFLADFCPQTNECIQENVKQFIATRRLFGRPVTVHHWNGRFHHDESPYVFGD